MRKYDEELQWWLREIVDVMLPWYRGERLAAWHKKLPEEIVSRYRSEWENCWATMARAQSDYYPDRLKLDPQKQLGRLLDVGCGPLLPARHLAYTELWCLDPMLETYRRCGFPIYDVPAVLLPIRAEDIWTVPDDFFDTVISVNALDHVDDFSMCIAEIERVTKPDGMIRIQIDYHAPTATEPIVLDDILFRDAFHQFLIQKIEETRADGNFIAAVWSNDDHVYIEGV